MNNKKVYAVALAGGEGTKLWPLSRRRRPKELLSFTKEASFLEQTVARISTLIPSTYRWAITTDEQYEAVHDAIGSQVSRIINEPDGRGTAAAMLHAALLIQQQDPHAVAIFLPTDHYIGQTRRFADFLTHAIDFAFDNEQITLLGLKALYPLTDYGYIAYQESENFPAPVSYFHEKPDIRFCTQYVQDGWLWNSGIIVAQVKTFIETCEKASPELFQAVFSYVYGQGDYYDIPTGSIDTLVLEKITNCAVLPVDFLWCDVGSLESFLSAQDHITGQQNVITIDANNNLVEVQNSLVALVGVDNVCVVQSDDVLLVVNRDQIDKVKLVIEVLKKQHNEDYL